MWRIRDREKENEIEREIGEEEAFKDKGCWPVNLYPYIFWAGDRRTWDPEKSYSEMEREMKE